MSSQWDIPSYLHRWGRPPHASFNLSVSLPLPFHLSPNRQLDARPVAQILPPLPKRPQTSQHQILLCSPQHDSRAHDPH